MSCLPKVHFPSFLLCLESPPTTVGAENARYSSFLTARLLTYHPILAKGPGWKSARGQGTILGTIFLPEKGDIWKNPENSAGFLDNYTLRREWQWQGWQTKAWNRGTATESWRWWQKAATCSDLRSTSWEHPNVPELGEEQEKDPVWESLTCWQKQQNFCIHVNRLSLVHLNWILGTFRWHKTYL